MAKPPIVVVVSKKQSRSQLVAQLQQLGVEVRRLTDANESAFEIHRCDLVIADVVVNRGVCLETIMAIDSPLNAGPNRIDAKSFLRSLARCETGLVFNPLDAKQSRAAIERALRARPVVASEARGLAAVHAVA